MGRKKMETFAEWLKKQKMTTEDFAKAAGVSYHTVVKWREGSKPRRFFREQLGPKYPTCPLFA